MTVRPVRARCGWSFPAPAAAVGTTRPLCQRCRTARDWFQVARAALCYGEGGVAREVILFCKHGRQLPMLRQLGDLLAEEAQLRLHLEEWEALVPVPLHWSRRWRRGFN